MTVVGGRRGGEVAAWEMVERHVDEVGVSGCSNSYDHKERECAAASGRQRRVEEHREM